MGTPVNDGVIATPEELTGATVAPDTTEPTTAAESGADEGCTERTCDCGNSQCDEPPASTRGKPWPDITSEVENSDMLDQTTAAAWNEYREVVGGVAYNGDPLPTWDQFRDDPNKAVQVKAWRRAVYESTNTYLSIIHQKQLARAKAEAGAATGPIAIASLTAEVAEVETVLACMRAHLEALKKAEAQAHSEDVGEDTATVPADQVASPGV